MLIATPITFRWAAFQSAALAFRLRWSSATSATSASIAFRYAIFCRSTAVLRFVCGVHCLPLRERRLGFVLRRSSPSALRVTFHRSTFIASRWAYWSTAAFYSFAAFITFRWTFFDPQQQFIAAFILSAGPFIGPQQHSVAAFIAFCWAVHRSAAAFRCSIHHLPLLGWSFIAYGVHPSPSTGHQRHSVGVHHLRRSSITFRWSSATFHFSRRSSPTAFIYRLPLVISGISFQSAFIIAYGVHRLPLLEWHFICCVDIDIVATLLLLSLGLFC